MKFNASHVVIDADIARSSGLSEHPVSSSSRELLQAILKSNINVVFCPILATEWKKHQSKFATMWFSSMVARKRVLRIKPNTVTVIEIQNSSISESQRQIAEKDAHIVDLALATNKFIASNDGRARQVFCLIAGQSTSLNGLFWVIPTESHDSLVGLITDGGYIPDEWRV